MESLCKSLREYFKHLIKHNSAINELSRKSEKPIDALKSLAEQHRFVAKAELENLPISRVPGIKDKLLFKIEASIDEEVVELEKIILECKGNNALLEKKLCNVKKCLEKAGDLTKLDDRKLLCFGSASCPSVMEMVEWADDSWRLFHALYLKMSNVILTVQNKDDREIMDLSRHYLHSEERKVFLERVFAMTRKFIDDT
ncbi:AFG2-interacting ribosome maturation factor-like [Hetaerina americana]|uniref:AFG2-interacting ribosome maturation factor-like n=1 Tax=Hetaerina americana TaxID=62018 RepID=UPI003A7F2F7C